MTRKPRRDRIAARVDPRDYFPMRFSPSEKLSLTKLSQSPKAEDRRLCVMYLDNGTGVARNIPFILDKLDKLIPDRSTFVRWQSLIMLEMIEKDHPGRAWPLILKWGSAKNRDIRLGIGICVLEDLLDADFSYYFPKIEAAIKAGNRRFGYTFALCSKNWVRPQKGDDRLFDSLHQEAVRKYRRKL